MDRNDTEIMESIEEILDNKERYPGFPVGVDKDILQLSSLPIYTAFPNPFINKFIQSYSKEYSEDNDNYNVNPLSFDITEGKNDPIYMLHSYHTKVPYKAILKYILHYTKPGDVVFDGFAGSGMTGIAAKYCDGIDKKIVNEIESELGKMEWGVRKAVLSDLSPIATFISHSLNSSQDSRVFNKEFKEIIDDVINECNWVYKTKHEAALKSNVNMQFEEDCYGEIVNVVWSDVFICPNCGCDIIYWDVSVDEQNQRINENFKCNECNVLLNKTKCNRAVVAYFDEVVGKELTVSKQIPVKINYSYRGARYSKKPDNFDHDLIEKIQQTKIPYWVPSDRMCEGSEARRNDISGVQYVHQFMTKRNLYVMSSIFNHPKLNLSRMVFTSILMNCTKTYRYRMNGKGGSISGTLYIPSLFQENNVISSAKRKFTDFKSKIYNEHYIVNTGSSTKLLIDNNSIDYIFTDPPFGSNLNYSELSFIWESWLKVKTNNSDEAIINKTQNKNLKDYQILMTNCFSEFYRILKPGRWMTVEFHNSQNSVWNAIQESLQRAGFIVADVRILNKKQDSFKQIKSLGAVKQDLVISAYKPKESFQREFISRQGTVQTAWDFVRQHLEKLPVVVQKNNKIEVIVERQSFLLFDRMVAYHIVSGISIPLDAADFYKGLDERFIKRGGMYFLHDQVNEYDNARIQTDVEDIQFTLFVSNEKTAIAWLYQQLNTPQTYAEIQPKFMQEIRSIEKHEKLPELSVLLEDNFLKSDNGKWYIPDTNKATDVIRLREKKLVKEFEEYLETPGKLKKFRTEAVRAGFAKLWKDRNYDLIVKTAERLPEEVVQEDDKILMYYDISLSRLG